MSIHGSGEKGLGQTSAYRWGAASARVKKKLGRIVLSAPTEWSRVMSSDKCHLFRSIEAAGRQLIKVDP